MANFFKYFPKTVYNLDDSFGLDAITNLTTTFSFDDNILQNSILYYEYTISDGETPEIVSHKIYGSSEKHWLIMKMNGISDVKNDWPLDQISFNDAVDAKYANSANVGESGIEWARSNIHSYYKIETRRLVLSGEETVDTIQIDANTYANVSSYSTSYTLPDNFVVNLSVDKKAKTHYDYEIEENELKRNIKILKREYIDIIEKEFREIMRNGR
jgi:hypothetical protein